MPVITLNLKDDTKEKLVSISKGLGVTQTWVIEAALREFFAKYNPAIREGQKKIREKKEIERKEQRQCQGNLFGKKSDEKKERREEVSFSYKKVKRNKTEKAG